MNEYKDQILQQLFNNDFENLETKINDYFDTYPYDVDMYSLAGYYYMLSDNFPAAKKYLLLNKEHNYYDADTYFLLGEYYFYTEEYLEAMKCYSFSCTLSTIYKTDYLFVNMDAANKNFSICQKKLIEQLNENPEANRDKLAELHDFSVQMKDSFYLIADILRVHEEELGKTLFSPENSPRYCGYFYPYNHAVTKLMPTPATGLIFYRGELLKEIYVGHEYEYKEDTPALIPIATEKPSSILNVSTPSENFDIKQFYSERFSYYRTKENLKIKSDTVMHIGEPVKLISHNNLKKLVLSFFVDGLSMQLLREEGLENVMPNTYKFFSKGLITNNFFTTSDWTYPSLASFVSGRNVSNHMMIHPDINKPLPPDTTTLFEHLKNAGYYTTLINSDFRSSSTYGYTRGIDRYLTQYPAYFTSKQIIPDAIEHLDTFRETNQYLWIAVSDLHDVADEYDLSLDTASKLDITEHKFEGDSATSVKQNFSLQKRKAYIQSLRTIDIQFGCLFSYIESNYKDDEFVVTMFGDHGQTYLVPNGTCHLHKYHSNSGFFVRGGGYSGISDEYISATDYSNILCKLANVDEPDYPDGFLPKTFGGSNERDYTITETIHPGDPYMASIHSNDYTLYFISENFVNEYCKIDKGEFNCTFYDKDGKEFTDDNLKEKFIDIINDRLKYMYIY